MTDEQKQILTLLNDLVGNMELGEDKVRQELRDIQEAVNILLAFMVATGKGSIMLEDEHANLRAYRKYIENNLERIERGGWTPVCFEEFLMSEERQIYIDCEFCRASTERGE